ncbi:MAG: D-alanine--D-alanine ligase [Epsilonproteobacteria bacterium]|nr:MAG: D-alanine--D-alanine ligase [Campylobacterota bacterium]RLA65199.1 MAG: D-alanine--D-alanine ligase [Campylobacterota bacterium]
MKKKRVLLLCGGGGPEHDISIISAKYIEAILSEIPELDLSIKELELAPEKEDLFQALQGPDFIIPCIHGPPGETGDVQAFLDLLKIPYLGAGPEASRICFNKITTKLWSESLNIPVTPYQGLETKNMDVAYDIFDKWGKVFIKPASQGSSIGCALVENRDQLESAIDEAFKYSPQILLEKVIEGRELEVAVYEMGGKIVATDPGEIILKRAKDAFYTYKEKYDDTSKVTTHTKAQALDNKTIEDLKNLSIRIFKGLGIRHLSRVDFFLTSDGQIYLNEINTFPGMTPISMFPKMLQARGDTFKDFLKEKINS